MAYVDGFVIPVKKDRLDEYKQIAQRAKEVWEDHGARAYVECVADDVSDGELTSFPRSVQLKEDEVVVFSWIVYDSRAHPDEVNEKVMKDPRMKMEGKDWPMDEKRMFWGGFEPIIGL